jgi:hypothetical protein
MASADNCRRQDAYTECYVAFLDILGFRQLVDQSVKDLNVLPDLIRVLTSCADLEPTQHTSRDVLSNEGKPVVVRNEREWTTQIRAFSDCVAIFIPTHTHALASVLCKVRYLHDRVLELHCCLRGAITFGGMYWNNAWSCPPENGQRADSDQSQTVLYDKDASSNALIALGPALIEAHRLESEVAVYPRVVFSARLMEHIEAMAKKAPENANQGIHKAAHASCLCSPSSENTSRCIRDFILPGLDSIPTGSDGVPFLDMFHRDIIRNDTQRIVREHLADGRIETRWVRNATTYEQFMRNNKETIESFLEEINPEKVRAKHLWLANYFNATLSRDSIAPIQIKW